MKNRILIIDDDADLNQNLGKTLRSHGFEVESIVEPMDAVAMARRFQPNLVILDVMMPGRSGYEVCKELRELTEMEHTPIIFVSAFADEKGGLYGMMQGGDDWLQKPFKPQELLMRITILLEDYER
ncbi:MAG: response regulator transcription factor [Planctomycetes bacterium]|nr:response regulator transcription factor [Planctomycetota bacterium]